MAVSRKSLLVGAALLAFGAGSARADGVTLDGQVGQWLQRATPIGAASPAQPVSISVYLGWKPGLKDLATSVSNPKAQTYGQYLKSDQVVARFGPDSADAAAVRAFLVAQGMTQVSVGPANGYVTAQTTVGQLSQTFGISQTIYSVDGRTIRAHAEAPSIPAALAGKIAYIAGLDETTAQRQPTIVRQSVADDATVQSTPAAASIFAPGTRTPLPTAANLPSQTCSTYYGDHTATFSTAPGPYPQTLPWLLCGYSPAQVRAAYGFDKVKYDGTGITIAIVDAYASPTLLTDLQTYSIRHHLKPVSSANFRQVIAPGAYNVPAAEIGNAQGWWGEQSLDVDAVHSTAPGANIIYVGSRTNDQTLDNALYDVILSGAADVITNSYGNTGDYFDPSYINEVNSYLYVAAVMGETVLFSSGDNGDVAGLRGYSNGSFPATDVFATSVGGTSLALLDSTGNKKEWGWSNFRAWADRANTIVTPTAITTPGLEMTTVNGRSYSAFSYYAGGGGGLSLSFVQPWYQIGVVPDFMATDVHFFATGAVATLTELGFDVPKGRVSPDISMVGDPYTGVIVGESYTISPIAYNNTNYDRSQCTPTSDTTEYCETPSGGTSLSSPLMAGVIAVVDQARRAAHKPQVGFANPWIYSLKKGVVDIVQPAQPTALLRGYPLGYTSAGFPATNLVRVITINSVPTLTIQTKAATATAPATFLNVCSEVICNGLGGYFLQTQPGYDNITGVGTPDVPTLVKQ